MCDSYDPQSAGPGATVFTPYNTSLAGVPNSTRRGGSACAVPAHTSRATAKTITVFFIFFSSPFLFLHLQYLCFPSLHLLIEQWSIEEKSNAPDRNIPSALKICTFHSVRKRTSAKTLRRPRAPHVKIKTTLSGKKGPHSPV